jgi:hypothetical protein
VPEISASEKVEAAHERMAKRSGEARSL